MVVLLEGGWPVVLDIGLGVGFVVFSSVVVLKVGLALCGGVGAVGLSVGGKKG